MTANELVCMFQHGTDIFIHMRYADKEETERKWREDASAGIWRGGDRLYGFTRYPIGDCEVESGSIFIPSRFGIKADYDVSFTVYEPNYSEKLRKKWEEEKNGSKRE